MYSIFNNDKQHVVRVARGEELVDKVCGYCQEHGIKAGWVQGLGACSSVTISSYNFQTRQYGKKAFEEDLEVLSLLGNVSVTDGKTSMHAHVSLSRHDMTVIGGHLHEMIISGTGEVYITEFEDEFTRRMDEETGLHLLDGDVILRG